jgi:hypothetical protein
MQCVADDQHLAGHVHQYDDVPPGDHVNRHDDDR